MNRNRPNIQDVLAGKIKKEIAAYGVITAKQCLHFPLETIFYPR